MDRRVLTESLQRGSTILTIENLDLFDGTPVLDIKAYVGDFDDRFSG